MRVRAKACLPTMRRGRQSPNPLPERMSVMRFPMDAVTRSRLRRSPTLVSSPFSGIW